jgi:hypothetical protein
LWLFIFELPPAGMMFLTILNTYIAQNVEHDVAFQASMRTLGERACDCQQRVFARIQLNQINIQRHSPMFVN